MTTSKLQKTTLFESEYCIIFQIIDFNKKYWYRKDKITGTKTIINKYLDYNDILHINKQIR